MIQDVFCCEDAVVHDVGLAHEGYVLDLVEHGLGDLLRYKSERSFDTRLGHFII